MGNREHYRDVEFEKWAHRSGLTAPEAFLVERYLDPEKETIEAGTGGGCILLELRHKGHERLHGFDFVPELIEVARRRDASASIDYRVADAVRLEYADASFDQALYLAGIICFIEGEDGRERAIREAYRILKPGGTAIFAFLCLEGRHRSALHRAFTLHLGLVRMLARSSRPIQLQPWLRRRGRINPRALLDAEPHVYWYTIPEMRDVLQRAGFRVEAAGFGAQVAAGRLVDPDRLDPWEADTGAFFVCRKAAVDARSVYTGT
jgi:SAM-dependent methyltransferase